MSPPNAYQPRVEYPLDSSTPPALPRHQEWSPTPTVNPNKLETYPDKSFSSSTDIPELDAYHVEAGGLEKQKKKRMENRNCCVRCMCCACCLPLWAACIIWFIVIAIIIVVIVLGSIAGTFVLPSVNLLGVISDNSSSPVSFSGYSIKINFGLNVNVNNPNLLGIQLSDMRAIAYYPIDDKETQVGSGYLASQYVPKYSNINFTFPFALEYDTSQNTDTTVINALIDKCGLTGNEKQPITIDYTITLAAKVLFITVHPTISSSSTFECPLDSSSLSGIEGSSLARFV